MNQAYTGLAGSYDGLTGDVNYAAWLRWYLKWFRREPVRQVLDLGCGTGTLTLMLAREGYDLIGVDAAPDMLAQAMEKVWEAELEREPLFVCQPMERLELMGPVDACVSSLDALNYVTHRKKLSAALKRVGKYLRPGGLFLFDVIPPWEFARRDGQVYVDEEEGTLCLWRASYDRRNQVITYGLDLFQAEGDHWTRQQEEHRERGWDLDQLTGLLREAGFAQVDCWGEDKASPPCERDSRVFFAARKRAEENGCW